MSSSSNNLTCALSGEPLNQVEDDVVVTPSGRLCRKKLLLSKLAENGGTDPFVDGRPLASDDLIELMHTRKTIMPPRPSTTSLSNLLGLMQKEYDALVLELFDTRKALEETRQELSQALYQNDASIRVVARLAQERDAAREQLQQWNANATSEKSTEPQGTSLEEPDAKRRRVEPEPEEPADESTIPESHVKTMTATWESLNKGRKSMLKAMPALSKEELNQFTELDSKSWHKTRSKAGILVSAASERYIVTAGRDKQIVTYDTVEKVLLYTISKVPSVVSCLDINQEAVIVSGSEDGFLRVYNAGGDFVDELNLSDNDKKKKDKIVAVQFHPTGQHVLAATRSGRVVLCGMQNDDKLSRVATFSSNKDTEYTCGVLHPDGLLYGAGTSQGGVHFWDFKAQKLATTLKQDNDDAPLVNLVFSNNAYHLATTTTNNNVTVWDLRKQKVLATLNQEGGDSSLVEDVVALSFDKTGKHLAYGGSGGVIVTTVKEWGVTAQLATDHDVSHILWNNHNEIVTSSSKERPVRFYGKAKDAMEE